MKHLILLTLVLTAFQSQAETYTCYFGNPFGEVTYDSNSQILRTIESSTKRTQGSLARKEKGSAILNVRLQDSGNGEISLISNEGHTLVKMQRSNLGTDGFTNFIYPFTATAAINADTMGDGACETNSLRAEKPEMNLIEEE